MSAENLKTTKFLFEKIKRIYPSFEIPDEFDVTCWVEILKGYSHDDILAALKHYRKTAEYSAPPVPGTFSKCLKDVATAHFPEYSAREESFAEDDEKNWRTVAKYDLAEGLRIRGGNKNLRYWYTAAIREIFAERVARLPESRFWDYGKTVAECFRRGFFDDVDEVAENIRQREACGKNTAPVSAMEAAGNWLASHWATGGAG